MGPKKHIRLIVSDLGQRSRSGDLKTHFRPTDAGLAEDLHTAGDYLLDKSSDYFG